MADGDFLIAQPEIFLGFPPGAGGTQRLTRLLGRSKALRVCLGGEPMSPREALDIGLVDRVVPPAELVATATTEAHRLGSRPKQAIGAIKRSINIGSTLSLADGLRYETAEFLACVSTPDSVTAQKAYVQKTKELDDVPAFNHDVMTDVLARGRFL